MVSLEETHEKPSFSGGEHAARAKFSESISGDSQALLAVEFEAKSKSLWIETATGPRMHASSIDQAIESKIAAIPLVELRQTSNDVNPFGVHWTRSTILDKFCEWKGPKKCREGNRHKQDESLRLAERLQMLAMSVLESALE